MKTNKLVLLIIMILLPVAVFAHAPKSVDLTYDSESGNLIVSVLHPVKDVADHYIESLTVTVNGEDILTLDYSTQSTLERHEVNIEMPDPESGDTVEVKVVCNKLGSKTGSITIE